ncbi:MAG TPA: MBOAT family O-acyltransferase [Bacteroidales bacterium]|nr:MBOAT family O-acyltransferase [Bacteroidales bacterium]HOR82646.1 MBOAT family O-acyltransferase [Bacteroidales bacterium]HPJ91837.1 MBOAT family O-acyltransferase [Bacteroidales bacterium]
MEINNIINYLYTIFSFNENQPLLFTQFYFWAFFAIVFAFFSMLHNKLLLRSIFLLFVSLFFYFKTSGLFVLMLVFAIVFNFFTARRIEKVETAIKKKIYLIFSVVIDLSVLFYFKYAYFFTDIYNNLFSTNNQIINYLAQWSNNLIGTHFTVDVILLPVGISFFTFQIISYVVDVYRGRLKAVTNIFDFGFYVSFFPQLVAGPIVRANVFIPQIRQKFFLSEKQFGIAVFWILNGMLKKMILSDYIAVNFIDRVFTNPMMYTGFENLMALFGYSLQVYADFSGYTDIAIGVAMLMGFHLPKNFNSPYKATNPGDFWKRWHISLSSWLKDYLYIPMGGNRNATFSTYFFILLIALIVVFLADSLWVTISVIALFVIVLLLFIFSPSARKSINTNINLMNTMLLGGLWHGASWNFMIWGGLNGVGIVIYKFWRKFTMYQQIAMTLLLFLVFYACNYFFHRPAFQIGVIWSGIIFVGTLISVIYRLITSNSTLKGVNRVWGIFLTFVFITFTRLFFRSGSNLNPAEANEIAWNTAKDMVNQIGGKWNFSLIPSILYEYKNIFLLFCLGMIIHWLPERWKRWYRINFALLPKPLMILVIVIVVFIIYQSITSDLQAFIYFQF